MEDFSLHPDLARDGQPVASLPLCEVLLIDDATYPWFVLVPRRPSIRDTVDLTPADHSTLWEESRTLSRVLMEVFGGEKLNVAALGNVTPQLHVHHVVRFAADPAWPGPIWGVVPMAPYAPEAREATVTRVRDALAAAG